MQYRALPSSVCVSCSWRRSCEVPLSLVPPALPACRAPEKGLRLRAPIAIDAPEYAGRRVSRSEFWEGEVENGDVRLQT